VGYLDTRFSGYGHAHVERTRRFLRCGFSGLEDAGSKEYLSIIGGLESHDAPSYRDLEHVERNAEVFSALVAEPVYRDPWRGDVEKAFFVEEVWPVERLLATSAGPVSGPSLMLFAMIIRKHTCAMQKPACPDMSVMRLRLVA